MTIGDRIKRRRKHLGMSADALGEKFAKEFGLEVTRFIPDWDGLGKRAGYVRNAEMAKYSVKDNNVR